jgi:hypothetical protein
MYSLGLGTVTPVNDYSEVAIGLSQLIAWLGLRRPCSQGSWIGE